MSIRPLAVPTAVAALAGLAAAAPAEAAVSLVVQDFQNPGFFFGNPDVSYSFAETMTAPADPSRRFWGLAPNGINASGTNPAEITVTNLQPHTQLHLEFDLYIIRTWDGPAANAPLSVGPSESWRVLADGASLFHTTFSHYGVQNYPAPIGGALHPFGTGAVEADSLGFLHPVVPQTQGVVDWVYRIQLFFPHSSGSVTIGFEGLNLEGAGNESFGIDNFRLVVPAPGAASALGLGALTFARRRRPARG